MKSTTAFVVFLTAVSQLMGTAVAASATAAASGTKPTQAPKENAKLGTPTSQGCFKSYGNMTDSGLDETKVSSGGCREACQAKSWPVFAMGRRCSVQVWKSISRQERSHGRHSLQLRMPGLPLEACGNLDATAWSVWNTGDKISIPYYEKAETSSSSSAPATTSTTASKPSSTGDPATTETSGSGDQKSGSSNLGAIIGGVVAGVVVICAIVGGLFFFMRRRRNSEIEEEYRRNAAVNAFISGSKPPGSSAGSISMTDSRLDPIKAHRLSDGSIADNEDYSRKILRVTNA
uniref:WSC domain-containing protein n=1 Tax=Bionectria ochroleuca TaxID=29856 RepID=A0A8H7NJA9_BIOOC